MHTTIKRSISYMLTSLLLLMLLIFPASATSSTEDFPEVMAASAILVDAELDTILYKKNIYDRRPCASITKLMTAILVVESIEHDEISKDTVFTASANLWYDIEGNASNQNIKIGEELTVTELLHCLLIASANESANMLAEGLCGSVDAFVESMNIRAAELGMNDTHFTNPHGLHTENQYTTAYDVYLMTKKALSYPMIQEIVSTSVGEVPATNLSDGRLFYNTNALLSTWKYLGYKYSAATGAKTGYTPEAGYCLASSAEQNERKLIAVILGAENIEHPDGKKERLQFSESKRLLQWGFSNFEKKAIITPSSLMREIPVLYGKDISYVIAAPGDTLIDIVPKNFEISDVEYTVTLLEKEVTAPISQGQKLGTISVSYNDKEYGSTDLIATLDVERSITAYLFSGTKSLLKPILLTALLIALSFVAVILSMRLWHHRLNSKKNKKGKRPRKRKKGTKE